MRSNLYRFGFLCTLFLAFHLTMLGAQANAAQLQPFELQLSNEVRSAVNAGVTLQFDCEFAKRKTWRQSLFDHQKKKHKFQLMRHALSNRFLVRKDSNTVPKTFQSISESMNYIAMQTSLWLDSYSSFEQPYSMRISLNKYKLPAPLRLKAFVVEDWEMDTGWIEWTSVN